MQNKILFITQLGMKRLVNDNLAWLQTIGICPPHIDW